MRIPALVLAFVAAATLGARADSLYAPAPPPFAAGHPMRLGADHRAQQVGDLVTVGFAQVYSNNYSETDATTKSLSLGATNILPHLPTTVGGTTGTQSSNVRTGTISFVSSLAAVVTNVLPSGALQIAGDSRMVINGQIAVLHLTGTIRVEDIDNTDTVLTSHIAGLNASFAGNFSDPNKGIIRRILDVLF
jgi:flagellar L-ring protein precursor FlgH